MSGGESYRKAGVDRSAAADFIGLIGAAASATYSKDVVAGIGGFAGLIRLPGGGEDPLLLVACADGVGTKILIAEATGRWRGIGRDLVAMNVNDMICCGARPLAFLDYIATGSIEKGVLGEVIGGIADGCHDAGCALLGGETAEMPGFYPEGRFDLAGFSVGIVQSSRMVDGSSIAPGDEVVGIASTGAHSNGYSLIRRILSEGSLELGAVYPPLTGSLGDALLEPTRIYVRLVQGLLERFPIKGMAHITGGGLVENLPRVLPAGRRIVLDKGSWPVPPLFSFLQGQGGIADDEMHKVFNMGIGFAIIVPPGGAASLLAHLGAVGESAFAIGRVIEGETGLELR
jgi:phosphoribosylformylglycinamidine cyclo-ligase